MDPHLDTPDARMRRYWRSPVREGGGPFGHYLRLREEFLDRAWARRRDEFALPQGNGHAAVYALLEKLLAAVSEHPLPESEIVRTSAAGPSAELNWPGRGLDEIDLGGAWYPVRIEWITSEGPVEMEIEIEGGLSRVPVSEARGEWVELKMGTDGVHSSVTVGLRDGPSSWRVARKFPSRLEPLVGPVDFDRAWDLSLALFWNIAYWKIYLPREPRTWFLARLQREFLRLAERINPDEAGALGKAYALARRWAEDVAGFYVQLRRLWETPRPAYGAGRVVSWGKLPEDLQRRLRRHPGMEAQMQEWIRLGMSEGIESPEEWFNRKQAPFLPLDTRFFPEHETEILRAPALADDRTEGLVILADNADALHTLLPRFKDTVRSVYIDPPYNSRKKELTYDDNRATGRWLGFLDTRLRAVRPLMSAEGVLFSSIGDTLKAQKPVSAAYKLHALLDEIFGERQYLGTFVRKTSDSAKWDAKFISNLHDYVIAYARDARRVRMERLPARGGGFRHQDRHVAVRGKYRLNKLDRGSLKYSESLDYPIIAPDGTEIWPGGSKEDKRWIWRWSPAKVEWGIREDFIVFKRGKDGEWKVYYKEYEKVDNRGLPRRRTSPHPSILEDFTNDQAQRELEDLFGKRVFEYPKPAALAAYLFGMTAAPGDWVMDFFAGSGSSLDAALTHPAGAMKYIGVESEESHFSGILLPRLKKRMYARRWKKGKPEEGEGIYHLFAYFRLEPFSRMLMRYGVARDAEGRPVLRVKSVPIRIDDMPVDWGLTLSFLTGYPVAGRTAESVILDTPDGLREIPLPREGENLPSEFVQMVAPLLRIEP
ncbi:MAG: site-specific DNA-methyltransferase [Chlorobi bacterium]|nr:site-specific DNA-methyltransferase [Chlorobiota bacterium]